MGSVNCGFEIMLLAIRICGQLNVDLPHSLPFARLKSLTTSTPEKRLRWIRSRVCYGESYREKCIKQAHAPTFGSLLPVFIPFIAISIY
jgi:hypothetical protein